MSSLFTDPNFSQDHHSNNTVSGAAYDNSAEDGYSIMPPENQFSTQPLEVGGKLDENKTPAPSDSANSEKGEWTTPRENEEISSTSKATIKLHQIKVHINYLLDLWEHGGNLSKKPESLEDLVSLSEECDDMMKFINEGDDNKTHLTKAEAQLLNEMSMDIDSSYSNAFGFIIGQSKLAAKNIARIPDMKGVDDGLKELIRQNFGDKDQEELDKIMYSLEGTKEYHRIVDALKTAAWNVASEAGGLIWAEGLKKLESVLSEALNKFKSNGEFLISFVSGIIDVFGVDESDSVGGMRKTFDLIDTIINNPLTSKLVPLWSAYKPAINFCLDGIDLIKKKRDEQFNQIGISQGLIKHVKNNDQNKIRTGMTLGLPGINEVGKRELLLFMMDMHCLKYTEACKVNVPGNVKTFFENNQDLINAGDKERLQTDYKNPLNPWDNELKDIASDAYIHRDTIWVMLYGTMLTPPSR